MCHLKNFSSWTLIITTTFSSKTILIYNNEYEEDTVQQVNTQPQPQQPIQNNSNKVKVGNREMTEDEYRQYLEFQKMYPEIAWDADAMFTGYESQSVSTVPVALR